MSSEEPQEEPDVDPVTTTVAAAGSLVGKQLAASGGKVMDKLLGPVAEEMGQDILRWYRNRNVRRVVDRADGISRDGTIPLRVAADVFEKAQYAEDEFVAEYLSGVLAGARTPEGNDDRAISWTALIGRLSSDQLRLHYIVVRAFRDLNLGNPTGVTLAEVLQTPMVLHANDVARAMFSQPLPEDAAENRVIEAFFGLAAENLVTTGSHGSGSFLNGLNRSPWQYPDYDILVVGLTVRGASLAVQAIGQPDTWPLALTDPDTDLLELLNIDPPIPAVRGMLLSDLPSNPGYLAARGSQR